MDVNSGSSPYSENPESFTIGEAQTNKFIFKFYSPGKNMTTGEKIKFVVDNPTQNIIRSITSYIEDLDSTEEFVENVKLAHVTVVGNEKGGGEVGLKVITYPKRGNPVEKTTTIKVVAAKTAHKIKFFDTDNNPLADNKLIAPKHIYKIEQSDNVASKGTQCSTLNKCLKTTDSSAYVKFTYWVSTGSTMQEKSDYSWVTLSDNFDLPQTGSMQALKTGNICLKGIINDQSRNISKNMLQKNGLPKQGGITYWYIVYSFIIMA